MCFTGTSNSLLNNSFYSKQMIIRNYCELNSLNLVNDCHVSKLTKCVIKYTLNYK